MNLSIFEKAGIDVINQGTVKEVFKDTSLDWEVKQHSLWSKDEYGNNHLVQDYVANHRSDNEQFLGFVHRKDYKVVQNVEAFDFIDQLPNFNFDKVGMFNNGRKVFVVGKSNEQIDIDGTGDMVDFYLTFLHGHDGKSGIRFILCPVRMFCMNQLNLMLEKATFKFNIAHTGDVGFKLGQIQRAISDSRGYIIGLQEEIEDMINQKPTVDINQFVQAIIPTGDDTKITLNRKEEAREAIKALYEHKPDLQNYKGTAFGMLSAVSDYISHLSPVRSNTDINNTFIKNIEGNELLVSADTYLKRIAA